MRIVCMGDSLTYGYGVKRAAAWPALVSHMLEDVEMVNRGISGDTTSGMMSRFEKDVLGEKPQMMFLMGGSNDIFFSHSISVAKNNIAAMVNRCFYERIRVALGVPFEICHPALIDMWAYYAEQPGVSELAAEDKEWLADFAKHFGVPLFEMEAALPTDREERIACSLDGVHLNEKGNRLVAEYVADRFRGILKLK